MAPPLPTAGKRLLATPAQVLPDRDAVGQHFERLNAAAPAARRVLHQDWRAEDAYVRAASVASPLADGRGGGANFLVEAEFGLGLDVITADPSRAPALYSVLLPLSGRISARGASGPCVAEAGQGLLIDPSDVEKLQVARGTHFVEFDLPKALLRTMGGELSPGQVGSSPRFAPLLQPALAQRLLWMAVEAANAVARPGSATAAGTHMFTRWTEMISLTLLQDHTLRDTTRASVVHTGPMPASLRRALAYMHANAEQPLLLADIAAAACVSASSLLRQCQAHLGESPVALLRHVRLDRARQELRHGHVESVQALARHWGFQSASKFAQAYQRRFGESPSQTRRCR